MLPPNFFEEVGPKICAFCLRDVKEIKYGEHGEKTATKEEIVKEYDIFLKMVFERNKILKDATKGDMSGIPEKLI
jgi:NifB/MoaA-like Fe-S oxidoreductase